MLVATCMAVRHRLHGKESSPFAKKDPFTLFVSQQQPLLRQEKEEKPSQDIHEVTENLLHEVTENLLFFH